MTDAKQQELVDALKSAADRLYSKNCSNEDYIAINYYRRLASEVEDSSPSSAGSLRWHRLDVVTQGKQVTEVMAAASDEGIGVIASWRQIAGEWRVWAIDTEGQFYEEITEFGEEECVPRKPPAFLLVNG